jgi:ABC-type amino acid transport substrate-binding protein
MTSPAPGFRAAGLNVRASQAPLAVLAGLLCASLLVGCGSSGSGASTATSAANTYNTLAAGVLTVGVYQDGMPYIGISNGKLTGLDGDLVNDAAAELHLTVRPVEVGTAFITDVQVRRADISVGDIGWEASRASAGLFTDPPYYSPVAGAVRAGASVGSYLDLEHMRVGGLTGDFFLGALNCLHVALHGYPSDETALADLAAGRIDIFLHDALTLQTVAEQHPNLHFTVVYPAPPSSQAVASCPGLTELQPFMTGWFINKQEPKLASALSKIIDGWYAAGLSGTLAQVIKQWGGDPQTMLVPQPYFTKERVGVDRPAGWTAPTIAGG